MTGLKVHWRQKNNRAFCEEWETMQRSGWIGDDTGTGHQLSNDLDAAPEQLDDEDEDEEEDDDEQSHQIEQQECVGNNECHNYH